MAFDASGRYIPEDQGVATRVTGLIQDDPTFIRRAKAEADRQANRRGLLNTSIAIQAGEEAAQKAALPIAAQEAGQIAQQNLSAQESEQQIRSQQARFGQETAENIAQRTFQASETAAERGFRGTESAAERGSRAALQTQAITSQEEQAEAERATRRGLLTEELESRERVEREGRELTASEAEFGRVHQRDTQEQQIGADRALAESGILANRFLAELDADTKVRLNNLSSLSQQKIAAANISGSERLKATEALVNIAAQYESGFEAIQDNPDIPAEARALSLAHLGAVRDANIDMIRTLYNFPINWVPPVFGGAPGAAGAAGAGAGTTPPVVGTTTATNINARRPTQSEPSPAEAQRAIEAAVPGNAGLLRDQKISGLPDIGNSIGTGPGQWNPQTGGINPPANTGATVRGVIQNIVSLLAAYFSKGLITLPMDRSFDPYWKPGGVGFEREALAARNQTALGRAAEAPRIAGPPTIPPRPAAPLPVDAAAAERTAREREQFENVDWPYGL